MCIFVNITALMVDIFTSQLFTTSPYLLPSMDYFCFILLHVIYLHRSSRFWNSAPLNPWYSCHFGKVNKQKKSLLIFVCMHIYTYYYCKFNCLDSENNCSFLASTNKQAKVISNIRYFVVISCFVSLECIKMMIIIFVPKLKTKPK